MARGPTQDSTIKVKTGWDISQLEKADERMVGILLKIILPGKQGFRSSIQYHSTFAYFAVFGCRAVDELRKTIDDLSIGNAPEKDGISPEVATQLQEGDCMVPYGVKAIGSGHFYYQN